MHPEDLCSQLDEYLAGDLAGPPREAFERHLCGCPHCREEAESYARLAEVLQIGDRQLVHCPPRLSTLTRDALWRRQFRRRITAAAAIVLLAAIIGAAWLANGRSGPAQPENRQRIADRSDEDVPVPALESDGQIAGVEAPRPFAADSPGERLETVRVEFGDDVIGVPVETGDPSITILWVYPTLGQVASGD
jgi:hypothetical protein